jgi:hypothetical protein
MSYAVALVILLVGGLGAYGLVLLIDKRDRPH